MVGCRLPYGTCSLMTFMEESKLTWKNYLATSDENHTDLEKWANDLDMSMLFIHGCNSDDMQNDLENMSALSQYTYPKNIESMCNIYCTPYSKTAESNNNGNKGNGKGWDKDNYDNDNNENKGGLISAHISMDRAAAILTAHTLNNSI